MTPQDQCDVLIEKLTGYVNNERWARSNKRFVIASEYNALIDNMLRGLDLIGVNKMDALDAAGAE